MTRSVLTRPVSASRWVLALAAVALVGLTAVVTNRLSTDDPSRFTTELHVTTGVVDAVQGFDAGGASNERVVCVVADRAVASDCYRVPVGLLPDPMPQIGQRVRILHGFMVEDLTDPGTSRRSSVVAIEILRLSVHRCGWDGVINRLGWL